MIALRNWCSAPWQYIVCLSTELFMTLNIHDGCDDGQSAQPFCEPWGGMAAGRVGWWVGGGDIAPFWLVGLYLSNKGRSFDDLSFGD